MTVKRIVGVLLAAAFLLPLIAQAQNARAMRGQVEASMLVTGSVDIARDGSVIGHTIDRSDKLPPYVLNLIERAVPVLRFEPVVIDSSPVEARARMSLRLVATPAEDGEMQVAIRSAHFGDDEGPSADRARATTLQPPRYPMSVAEIGGKGTVYLLVKVGRDGSIEDVVAEQVNLTALGSARQMESIRRALSNAAVVNARRWAFTPSSDVDSSERQYWVVRVPVTFQFEGDQQAAYGEWSGYLPGPKHRPDWVQPDPPGFSPDALAAGDVHPEASRFRLLTPLEG